MARDRSYTKMDLTGIGGRDSRGTSCDLANISVPGAQPNNYALTSNTVSGAPGSLEGVPPRVRSAPWTAPPASPTTCTAR